MQWTTETKRVPSLSGSHSPTTAIWSLVSKCEFPDASWSEQRPTTFTHVLIGTPLFHLELSRLVCGCDYIDAKAWGGYMVVDCKHVE